MRKKIITMMLAVAFLSTTAAVSYAKFNCKVESVDGSTIVLKDCDAKKAKRIKPGNTVSVTKKRKALEGC